MRNCHLRFRKTGAGVGGVRYLSLYNMDTMHQRKLKAVYEWFGSVIFRITRFFGTLSRSATLMRKKLIHTNLNQVTFYLLELVEQLVNHILFKLFLLKRYMLDT